MTLVSVIVPTYNRAHYLRDCLDSILSQSPEDYEIVVVDDGSTDGSDRLVGEYIRRFGSKVRYISTEHGGVARARNRGLLEARGEFVAFCDSDDVWLPGKLERQVSYLQSDPSCAMVVGECLLMGKEEEGGFMVARSRIEERSVLEALFETQFVNLGASMARLSILRSVGGFDETLRTSEDYDIALRIASKYKIVVHRDPVLLLRRHESNITNDPMTCMNRYKVLRKFLRRHARSVSMNVVHGRMTNVCNHVGDTLLRTGSRALALRFYIECLSYSPDVGAVLRRVARCVLA